jgi:uncharacterized membrane protein YsdA (DUF1294 family)
MSLTSFALYGVDKRRAAKGTWRVSERTLQFAALLGGWPGAWAGQNVFRHKTQKLGFRVTLLLITAAHVVLIGWWLTSNRE